MGALAQESRVAELHYETRELRCCRTVNVSRDRARMTREHDDFQELPPPSASAFHNRLESRGQIFRMKRRDHRPERIRTGEALLPIPVEAQPGRVGCIRCTAVQTHPSRLGRPRPSGLPDRLGTDRSGTPRLATAGSQFGTFFQKQPFGVTSN